MVSCEVKIICFAGKAMFKYIKANDATNSIPGYTDSDLFEFAEEAIAHLKERCPSFFMDQLVRVDIFYDSVRKCLCVNEFESLEAHLSGGMDNEQMIQDLVYKYYFETAKKLIKFHYNRLNMDIDLRDVVPPDRRQGNRKK